MSIYVQNTNITGVNLNQSALSIVNCNGFQVFPETIYQFPCETAYLPDGVSETYGFNIKFDGQKSGALAKYAFNNSTESYYCYCNSSGTYSPKVSDAGDIGILFPFYIQVQSVSIINSTKKHSYGGGSYGGLNKGVIYLVEPLPDGSTENNYLNQISSTMESNDFIPYIEFDRGGVDKINKLGYETTHSNPEMANTWTRWVVLKSSEWMSCIEGVSTSYAHIIGDIRIKFKANPSDIQAWNDKYSILTKNSMEFVPVTD